MTDQIEGRITLPFRPAPVSIDVKPIYDDSDPEAPKWWLYIDLRTDSVHTGFYLPPERGKDFLEGVGPVLEYIAQQIDQARREREVFSEDTLRIRTQHIPPSVAEAIWANVNVDEGDDVDAVRNSMPLPIDPTNHGRLSAPEEG